MNRSADAFGFSIRFQPYDFPAQYLIFVGLARVRLALEAVDGTSGLVSWLAYCLLVRWKANLAAKPRFPAWKIHRLAWARWL